MIAFEFVPNRAQAKLLATSADVCLYGGSAGSGKSLVAIIDLLGLNEPGMPRYMMPHYRGLIYRKRSGDLVDLIDKAKRIYPLVDPGAIFHHTDKVWTFSSGAKIYFKYFERFDIAETFLQGQELQTIYAEEVGQHDDDRIFKYAISRLRSSQGIKCYMRATANPSRYKWLRSMFRIDDDGTETDFIETYNGQDGKVYTKRIQFIRGTLADNPHISPEYVANLLMLPEDQKNALLYGKWNAYDTVDGQVYEHELPLLVSKNRYCFVPFDPSQAVYTYWDIGIGDLTVILFVQFVGKEIRIIDMLKGNNQGIAEHFAPTILKWKDDKGYRYGMHYFPHDAAQRDKWSGKSLLDMARTALTDAKTLPRLPIATGLQLAKEMFRTVWIDKSNCESLYDDLVHYRREWNEKLQIWGDEPVHDKHSHGADAFRMIAYEQPKPKIDLAQWTAKSSSSTNPFTRQ